MTVADLDPDGVGAVAGLRLAGGAADVVAAASTERPDGLLVAVALVCVAGAVTAVIRAIVTHNPFSD